MNHGEIGRAHRRLRTRAGLRQSDVAASAGVGRWKVVNLEAGELGDLFVRDLISCFDVLEARIDIDPRWRGAGLDRLLDEIHAQLVGHVLRLLRKLGWLAEVGFIWDLRRPWVDRHPGLPRSGEGACGHRGEV